MSVKNKFLKLISVFLQIGIDPVKFVIGICFIPKYLYQLTYIFFTSREIRVKALYPQLLDWPSSSGSAKGHYFHQDIIVARWIYLASPSRHVDIASRIDGFVAHLAVFRKIEVFDIRELQTNEKNISFRQLDFMNECPYPESLESISCLHSLEHFGLGRYTDRLDVNGHLKGFANILAMLKPGGIMYFSIPIGPLRIEFNAHRVFSVSYIQNYIIEAFELKIVKCAVITDKSDVFEDVCLADGISDNFGCEYGALILAVTK
jgi:SAM-dependent methyltransferase